MLPEIDKYQRKGKVKMKRKTLILGSIGGILLFLLLRDVFRLIRLGWFLVLPPLLGAVLAAIVSLLVLWLLWR
jgi:predicted RND superfamily exporter protein